MKHLNYNGIMENLYPNIKKQYIELHRPTYIKEMLLRKFQEDGFYLVDLLEIQKSFYPFKDLSNAVPNLISKISTIPKYVPIIIIKVNVYDILAPRLSELGYNVIPERISFPCSGQQKKFASSFKKAIEMACCNK